MTRDRAVHEASFATDAAKNLKKTDVLYSMNPPRPHAGDIGKTALRSPGFVQVETECQVCRLASPVQPPQNRLLRGEDGPAANTTSESGLQGLIL